MANGQAAESGGDPFAAGPIPYGRYLLTARIGAGGMAEVFRAVMKGPQGFERELVVKRILAKYSQNPQFVSMFVNEAKISALLSHPNIVQIYEFGHADETYFIAMENVHGVSLRDLMIKLRQEKRRLPFLIAADIARQICLGLHYAHTLAGPDGRPLEIIHRDVTPTNIMLAWNGSAKVVDFGIARAANFAAEDAREGIIKGKISYLAPEQIDRQPMDGRVDVFAAGVVLHEMLTGRKLFQANNDLAKMRQLLATASQPPSALDATVPRELDRIVMRALERDPDARYPSAAAMAADLERTLIAARHSSRELESMLRDLYHPSTTDLQIVVEEDAGTVIEIPKPTASSLLPVTESFRGASSAEQSRLHRARWRTRARALLALALLAVAGSLTLTLWSRYGAQAWTKYAVPLLHAAPPPRPAPPPAIEAPPPAPVPPPPAAERPALKRHKPAKHASNKHP